MNKHLFLFLSFGCIGITTEVFFTAVMDYFVDNSSAGLTFKGHSYIWMFPIYGLGILIFQRIYGYFAKLPTVHRIFIFAVIILIIEFIAGWLLDTLTGSCPWEYQEGIHVGGYARLDYIFFWMFFCYLMEKVFLFIQDLYKES